VFWPLSDGKYAGSQDEAVGGIEEDLLEQARQVTAPD
jgi:hypothetical protein